MTDAIDFALNEARKERNMELIRDGTKFIEEIEKESLDSERANLQSSLNKGIQGVKNDIKHVFHKQLYEVYTNIMNDMLDDGLTESEITAIQLFIKKLNTYLLKV